MVLDRRLFDVGAVHHLGSVDRRLPETLDTRERPTQKKVRISRQSAAHFTTARADVNRLRLKSRSP
jgi:hypothetical protein